jgi:ketosteroid isomerase-like protein
VAGEPGNHSSAIKELLASFDRAASLRDWIELRALVAADAVVADSRVLGLGTIGRDRWIQSLQFRAELVSDAALSVVRVLASSGHGQLRMMTIVGHFPDGSAFDNPFLAVMQCRDGQILRLEFFESSDEERARERFTELCQPVRP